MLERFNKEEPVQRTYSIFPPELLTRIMTINAKV